MSLKCGIVGLPNVGKSTLFNLLSNANVPVSNYPFTTIDPHIGVSFIKDERLKRFSEIMKSSTVIPAGIEFVDIAGLVRNAHKGEGLGNQFISHIRDVDAICHVVRCFENTEVVHTEGSTDPERDIEIVELELTLADMELVQRRMERLRHSVTSGVKEAKDEMDVLDGIFSFLKKSDIKGLKSSGLLNELKSDIKLVSTKSYFFIGNTSDGGERFNEVLKRIASRRGVEVVFIDGKIENELREFNENEKMEFLKSMGIAEEASVRVANAGYKILDLITFYTGFERKEARAWAIKRGSNVMTAAGRIHTDMERGFIKADVIPVEKLISAGSEHTAREKGLWRTEGRDYIVEDGDVLRIKFGRQL